jgi:hypothetical protein
MKTKYVNTKAEMTAFADLQQGETFRTRLTCGCKQNQNRRNGILVVLGEQVTWKLIRCKACTAAIEDTDYVYRLY